MIARTGIRSHTCTAVVTGACTGSSSQKWVHVIGTNTPQSLYSVNTGHPVCINAVRSTENCQPTVAAYNGKPVQMFTA